MVWSLRGNVTRLLLKYELKCKFCKRMQLTKIEILSELTGKPWIKLNQKVLNCIRMQIFID